MATIQEHLTPETRARLDKNCWITKINSKRISIQRESAIGDVLMASMVAKKFHEAGYSVEFKTAAICAEPLRGVPFIQMLSSTNHQADILLDKTYEKQGTEVRKATFLPKFFMEQALAQSGIPIVHPFSNLTPQLQPTPKEKSDMLERLQGFQRPWTCIVPRSNSWPSRTVNRESWAKFAGAMKLGTLFWTGTEASVLGCEDLKLRTLRELMALFSAADMVVSVDTGPLHLAAAVGARIVAITQSINIEKRLSNQRDWTTFNPPLDCLRCHQWKCPINETVPPCQTIDGEALARTVKHRLNAVHDPNGVSVIIASYNPDPARLEKCISHVLSSVAEVIVAFDGNKPVPSLDILRDPKVRVIPSTGDRIGFGKTANRAVRNSHRAQLLFLNDDVFVQPDTVARLLSAWKPDVAVIGSLLRYPDGTIQHGGTGRFETGYGHIDHKQKNPSITKTTEMEFVTLACALVKRSVFYGLKGFDERYDCYHDDSDFCLRARQRGLRVLFEPTAEAVHLESQSMKGLKNQLLQDSRVIFDSIWGWYFQKNKHHSALGSFK
jgi:GT2 family glycosyltransferase/ADP-heptose:LPS heptosyltransferase